MSQPLKLNEDTPKLPGYTGTILKTISKAMRVCMTHNVTDQEDKRSPRAKFRIRNESSSGKP